MVVLSKWCQTPFKSWSSWSSKLKYALIFLAVVPLLLTMIYGASEIIRLESNEKAHQAERHANQVSRGRRGTNQSQQTVKTEQTSGGAVFIRWGRKICPDATELIYHGSAGGSFFSVHGGGANYLCLPLDPLWGYFNEAAEKPSKLYGAEYQDPSPGFGLNNAENKPLQDHNVPCAVCRSQVHSSKIMIPARNLCYDGWTHEYNGYLVSGAPGHQGRTEFVCMDENPETMTGGYPDENGALFYMVEAVCGSLPCPPYIVRREITCVVCTK